MSILVRCQEISKGYGARDLFRALSVSLFSGDRVGLVGPNGAGKSTLLKVMAKLELPDEGEVICSRSRRVGYLSQKIESESGPLIDLLIDAMVTDGADPLYEKERRAKQLLSQLGFEDFHRDAETLSGGWKRRFSLARVLINEPDVLLLDEPTNHLDLDTILWLENFLRKSSLTFVVVSHDRVFLEQICNKMWEVSHRYPSGIFVVEGGYDEFVERKEAYAEAQLQQQSSLSSKVRREEEWLKQNPKARSTKSRSRIQEAARLKHELAALKMRNKESRGELALENTGRASKKLLTAKNVGKKMGDRALFSGVEFTLHRGERIGIAGENGSGKSTLLKLLSQQLPCDTGEVQIAQGITAFLFDQHRQRIDPSLTLRQALAPGGEFVRFRGTNMHVSSWCERLLFRKEQLDLPVGELSGGERARVVMARCMCEPADILLFDEPTNDLDIETLTLLEESLDEFSGGVILVTHDRALMDRVADKILALGPRDKPKWFPDTSSWFSWREAQTVERKSITQPQPKITQRKKSLTHAEKKEYEGMEARITALEGEIAALAALSEEEQQMGSHEKYLETFHKMAALQESLEQVYARWQELEEIRSQ